MEDKKGKQQLPIGPPANALLARGILYAVLSLMGLGVGFFMLFVMVRHVETVTQYGLTGKVYYVLLIPLSLGAAAFLFGCLRSYASFSGQIFGGAVELGGPAALFMIVIFGGFYLVNTPETFDFSVRVHGIQGRFEFVSNATVMLDLHRDLKTKFTNAQGEVTFKEIPPSYLGSTHTISVKARGYSSVSKDFPLGRERVYVQLEKSSQAKDECIESKKLENLMRDQRDLFAQGYFELAANSADSIIAICESYYRSWFVKGANSFYLERYNDAVTFFLNAIKYGGERSNLIISLGDSYIANDQPRLALRTYSKLLSQGGQYVMYAMGRCYFYLEEYAQALEYLNKVLDTFGEQGVGHGKARIMEAAALVGWASEAPNDQKRDERLFEAKLRFQRGFMQDPEYWRRLLIWGHRDKHESYDKAKTMLKDHIEMFLMEIR